MSFLGLIKNIITTRRHLKSQIDEHYFQIRRLMLTDKALHCNDSGITTNKLCDADVVVSLTTYGKRLHDVYLAIESIMQGSVLPNKIVLWLGKNLEDVKLPMTLERQRERGLTINYVDDIRSYTKLIPALRAYPESCIITIDDDCVYDFELVENLVNSYNLDKSYIYSNRLHRIKLDKNGNPLSYIDWDWQYQKDDVSSCNLLTGVGGVLYPPHCFNEEVFREDVFLRICKTADDIWFYAMSLLNNKFVKKSFTRNPNGEDFIINNGPVQDTALSLSNNNPDLMLNDIQLKAVFDRYGLYEKLR